MVNGGYIIKTNPIAKGIFVVPEEKELIKSAELGIKYPIATPINIAKKIQSVKNRSKNPNLFFIFLFYLTLDNISQINLKETKFSRDRLRRSEYHQCRCGCSFRMIISFSPDGVTSTIRETDIPVGHVDVEENPDTRECDKEIHDIIDKLIESNKYAKNFGPKRIIDDLRHQHISDSRIPSEKQLQNKLHYYRRTKFNFTN